MSTTTVAALGAELWAASRRALTRLYSTRGRMLPPAVLLLTAVTALIAALVVIIAAVATVTAGLAGVIVCGDRLLHRITANPTPKECTP